MGKIGAWAFAIGLVAAIVVSVFFTANVPQGVVLALALLGVAVGLLNVTGKEVQLFLIAALTFLLSFQALSSVFTTVLAQWQGVDTFFGLMAVFMAPAAAVVAFKALYMIAKD